MNYAVRELRQDEVKVLYNFLYETIFMPEGILAPSKDIINQPELWVYVNDFGDNKGDLCFIARLRMRLLMQYGFVL